MQNRLAHIIFCAQSRHARTRPIRQSIQIWPGAVGGAVQQMAGGAGWRAIFSIFENVLAARDEVRVESDDSRFSRRFFSRNFSCFSTRLWPRVSDAENR